MSPALRFPTVAIVGATGAVGAELIACISRRRLPHRELRLLASARSAGKRINVDGRPIEVEALTERSFAGVDLALFSAGAETSRRYAPIAVENGAVVVDGDFVL